MVHFSGSDVHRTVVGWIVRLARSVSGETNGSRLERSRVCVLISGLGGTWWLLMTVTVGIQTTRLLCCKSDNDDPIQW
jgi:hypothetical protein